MCEMCTLMQAHRIVSVKASRIFTPPLGLIPRAGGGGGGLHCFRFRRGGRGCTVSREGGGGGGGGGWLHCFGGRRGGCTGGGGAALFWEWRGGGGGATLLWEWGEGNIDCVSNVVPETIINNAVPHHTESAASCESKPCMCMHVHVCTCTGAAGDQ